MASLGLLGDRLTERQERLEERIRQALTLLAELPPTDPRVALLHLAVRRRDLALLDGVLSEVERSRPRTSS